MARRRMTTPTAPIRMSTEAPALALIQWLSPAFPLGSFAYSHGLEAAVAEGAVRDAGQLEDWLDAVLHDGAGRTDAIWLRLAHAASDEAALTALDAEARAFAGARERLVEAERQGAAFARTVGAVWGHALPPLLLPLAVGRATVLQGQAAEAVLPLYLHAFMANLAAAAQRLMPLGQTAAQAIVARRAPGIAAVVGETRGATLDDIATRAIAAEIAALRHETLEPRIFAT